MSLSELDAAKARVTDLEQQLLEVKESEEVSSLCQISLLKQLVEAQKDHIHDLRSTITLLLKRSN